MTLKIADLMRDSMVDQLVAILGNDALCKIYTGTQPADADTAATGTLLVTIVVDGIWDASTVGVAPCGPSTSVNAVATGVPGYARVSNNLGANWFDCSVGLSGTDIIINASPLTAGQGVQILSMSVGFPTL